LNDDEVELQRDQVLRVNNTHPLPRGQSTELLPEMTTNLPARSAAQRVPAAICEWLNRISASPFCGLIRRASTGRGAAVGGGIGGIGAIGGYFGGECLGEKVVDEIDGCGGSSPSVCEIRTDPVRRRPFSRVAAFFGSSRFPVGRGCRAGILTGVFPPEKMFGKSS
jgi:hypothetical protein